MRNPLALIMSALLTCFAVVPNTGEAASKPAPRPNIIVILADDLAYSDISPYGGEIDTPNLAALAAGGTTFTNFRTSPMCSPSRAMLLTGVQQHRTGLGTMAEFLADSQRGQPGYEGFLNNRVATIAERLKPAGYTTIMAGKWHLGEQSRPSDRGFDHSFTLIDGAGSHFSDAGYAAFKPKVTYLRNGETAELPKDFYSSDFYTSEIIDSIQQARASGKPFFAYLSFTAPHWPLHAPRDLILKYDSTYAAGWDTLRENRFKRLQRLGIISNDAVMAPSHAKVPRFASLPVEQQRYQARLMAVYAAMVDRLDWNIGRLVSYLDATGIKDNTIIVFLSDNGAEAIDFTTDPIFPPATDWIASNFDNSFDNLGAPSSYAFYGRPWAQAGAAGHRLYKTFVAEGGIRSPLIVSWPSGGLKRGRQTSTFATLVEIVPTLLEAAKVDGSLTRIGDREIEPVSGRSMLPFLKGRARTVYGRSEGQGFELFGNKAYISGEWKILHLTKPEGEGRWQLFNLVRDPAEANDVSAQNPKIFRRMITAYEAFAKANGVRDLPTDFNMFDNASH
ncbi:arylsulfatase [Blastomonas sp.]|uniref:arylsulfatase n=1 Tax=Blastomonas sp. TaxID=1909299 RepID=UPI003592FFB4